MPDDRVRYLQIAQIIEAKLAANAEATVEEVYNDLNLMDRPYSRWSVEHLFNSGLRGVRGEIRVLTQDLRLDPTQAAKYAPKLAASGGERAKLDAAMTKAA